MNEERAASLICRLLGHYYWAQEFERPERPPPGWLRELRQFDPDVIEEACRRRRCWPVYHFPTLPEIKGLCFAVWAENSKGRQGATLGVVRQRNPIDD